MKALLVEPDIPLRYPNLGLLKLATKYKNLGYEIEYVKGKQYFIGRPDVILISTMFTYYSKETLDCINFYKNTFKDAEIQVGGIFATLMPDLIEKETGVKPKVGCFEELDRLTPDYSIIPQMIKYSPYIEKWKDFSILFSTRGCPRNCAFCSVKTLEPNTTIIPNWKELIDLTKKNVMFQDNNLTSFPIEHFKDVMNFIIENKLHVCFNNGFDCRILNEEQMQLMAKVKWYPGGLRLAFDNMGEDKFIQKCVKRLLELGVSKSSFLIFCMFNFEDTFEEAMYRHTEMVKLKVRPYPQVYSPLDWLNKKVKYISPNWTLELIREFRNYFVLAGNYKYMTFDEYLAKKGKKLEDLR